VAAGEVEEGQGIHAPTVARWPRRPRRRDTVACRMVLRPRWWCRSRSG